MEKGVRVRIAARHPELQNGGMKPAELAGARVWAAKSPAVKVKAIEAAHRSLHLLRRRKTG